MCVHCIEIGFSFKLRQMETLRTGILNTEFPKDGDRDFYQDALLKIIP